MSNIEWFILIGILMFLLLSCAVIFFAMTYIKKTNEHQKNLMAIQKENEVQLLKATLDTQENERERIGANLHDDIGPLLSSLKLYFRSEISESDGIKKEELQSYIDILDDNIEQVRDFSRELVPSVLKKFGLETSIQELKRRLEKGNQVQLSYSIPSELNLDSSELLSLYRITQEACNNALKHGKADSISIIYQQEKQNGYVYSINDSGKGFDIDRGSKGLGLRNIEARAKAIGCRLEITTSPSNGSSIVITKEMPHA